MIGHLDFAQPDVVVGWAFDPDTPHRPVILDIVVDGALVGRVVANTLRQDLRRLGFGADGDGRCAFEFLLPQKLSPYAAHEIVVRNAGSGAALDGSPFALAAVAHIGNATLLGFRRALMAAVADDADAMLAAVKRSADRLRQLRDARTVLGSGHATHRLPLAVVFGESDDPILLAHVGGLVRQGFRVVAVFLDGTPGVGTLFGQANVDVADPAEFAVPEDVLVHFAGEIGLVEMIGLRAMTLYGAVVPAHAPAARILFVCDGDAEGMVVREAVLRANVTLVRDADAATRLRTAALGDGQARRDIRLLPAEIGDERGTDRLLSAICGSSRAPRIGPPRTVPLPALA